MRAATKDGDFVPPDAGKPIAVFDRSRRRNIVSEMA